MKKHLVTLYMCGFRGKTLEDVIAFVEYKINEYWVDYPPAVRDWNAKLYAKICNGYKHILKDLKKEV